MSSTSDGRDNAASEFPTTEASGSLFLYSSFGLAAFEATGPKGPCPRALVCLGGLTDGLLSLRYLPRLAEKLRGDDWRVIQPVLRSSYRGWGVGSLQEDCEDLDVLLRFIAERRNVSEVALLGSSTGCQDIIWYLRHGKRKSMVSAAVLQAPVSDREALITQMGKDCAEDDSALKRMRSTAADMISKGCKDEVMPRAAGKLLGPDDPVTAYRFASLTGRLTDDDMFSSDLSDVELHERLGHVRIPTLLVSSADDEYVPTSVDVPSLLKRMSDAMPASAAGLVQSVVVSEGGHGLQTESGTSELCAAVSSFLSSLGSGIKLTWEIEYAREIRAKAALLPSERPFLVALAGMPGSGKSTSSRILRKLLGERCIVLGMDGFHVPLDDLRKRPDASEAIYRRGAPDTFDAFELERRLALVADPRGPVEVEWPGFDHEVGDPTPGSERFAREHHRIVIVEGLYLLLDEAPWCRLRTLFDWCLYLDSDVDACIERVKERNKVIPGYTAEEIARRCEEVDRRNAMLVMGSAGNAHASIPAELSH
eukprot:TRINITY_DN10560_c0_g2_i1.p1 TRINITY_DN10560_c0_g2~~TRINITY_DN10560_c0_g2_i1.p1  ORF type:complete len:597 (+),score=71.28 TRINITY_DN10560_c0_g2_i1:182-1792(+)